MIGRKGKEVSTTRVFLTSVFHCVPIKGRQYFITSFGFPFPKIINFVARAIKIEDAVHFGCEWVASEFIFAYSSMYSCGKNPIGIALIGGALPKKIFNFFC